MHLSNQPRGAEEVTVLLASKLIAAAGIVSPAIANLILATVDTKVAKEQLAFWIDVMQKQNMLSHPIGPAKFLF